jgi:glycosyltransferase involved in cell wall biosynthesis
MLLGSPLIVSDCRPQAEIVTQSECGLVFRSGNEEDLARQIRELYNNPDMREKMAKNGTKAIHEKYNLANSIKVLIDAYKKLKPER